MKNEKKNEHHDALDHAYSIWHIPLLAKASQMSRGHLLEDDVASFWEKSCHKTAEEIHDMFLGEKANYGLVITVFKNHVINRIRGEKAK